MVKIDKKIVGYKIGKDEVQEETAPISTLLERPALLLNGTTYKIKPSNEEHSYYITINNLDNVPFEVFVNSKNTSNFQFISALTRMISAIFRKGGDISFVVEELTVITAPNSGYWGKDKSTGKGKYYNSLVHEIGDIINFHLASLNVVVSVNVPDKLLTCSECKEDSLVIMDGCLTCTSCGFSKCG
jgi:ribonucleoside-diphosphate reductase alpha chain